jgi:ABC-type methionine transport system ATPase subunit
MNIVSGVCSKIAVLLEGNIVYYQDIAEVIEANDVSLEEFILKLCSQENINRWSIE